MTIEISLIIKDDGSMYVSVDPDDQDSEEEEGNTASPGGPESPDTPDASHIQRMPVSNIAQALAAIKAVAGEAVKSLATKEGVAPDAEQETPDQSAPGEEDQAMQEAYKG